MVSRNSKTVSIETLKKEQTTIESFFEETIPQLDGFKVVPLGNYLKRIRKESLFGVSDSTNPEDLSVIQINREKPYSPYEFMANSYSIDSFSIYEPTYYLETDSLLVNEYGNLDARLYRGVCEPAVFSDGLAFAVSSRMWPPYIVNELRKPYVLAQLNHWSTSKDKHHSEDEILDLKIYVPEAENPFEKERDICKKELDETILPNGLRGNVLRWPSGISRASGRRRICIPSLSSSLTKLKRWRSSPSSLVAECVARAASSSATRPTLTTMCWITMTMAHWKTRCLPMDQCPRMY